MVNTIMQKLKSILSSLTLSRRTENRVRRVIELLTFGFGIVLIVVSGIKILFFSGTFMDNAIGFACGLIAINVAYRGIIEDLPKFGALTNRRNFWG